MKNNISTFNYMIENRKVIIETVNENVSIPKAWDQLKEKLPKAEKVVKFNTFKFNTFKGYVKTLNIVNDIMNEKDKLLKTNEMLRKEIGVIRQEKIELEIKLGKVRQDYKEISVQ